MKKIVTLLMLIAVTVFAQKAVMPKAETLNIKGLVIPESVMVYNGKVYVSNLGDPDKAKDGFIIEASEDGKMAKKLFENELDSPKGFAFLSANLVVIADQVNNGSLIGNVVLADAKANKIIAKLPIEGSKFLNDAVMVSKNTVAVTDTGAGKVYLITVDGKKLSYKEIAMGVVGANGITIVNGMFYIAGSTFGGDAKGGNIYTMNLDGSSLTKWYDKQLGSGGLDGIAAAGNYLYVSDWENGAENKSAIYVIDLKTKKIVQKLQGNLTAVADFDLKDDFIYAPEFTKSTVKKVNIK